MASQIRFKFKNAKESDAVLFGGAALPLDALKRAIVEKKGLLSSGVDLIVTDAQTLKGTLQPELLSYLPQLLDGARPTHARVTLLPHSPPQILWATWQSRRTRQCW